MSKNIITALDIGTSTVQTVVAERKKSNGGLRILGIGVAPSSGIRRGIVVDFGEAISSVRHSVEEAQKSAGVTVRSLWLSVEGANISVTSSRGVVAVSRADGEISQEDARRAIAAAEQFLPKNPDKEILHIIPRDFKVDNEPGIKDPVGMHGIRLEADTLIIECSVSFLKNLLKCVENAGFKVEDYVFAPLAAAESVLSKRQKELGVMLLDLGGGTSSFIIYEEGIAIHAGVIPIGGSHITNDIAIGFKTHVDVAEKIKLAYGGCFPADIPKREMIRLAEFVEGDETFYPRRDLAEIIEARLRDIFELLQKELKKIGRAELLPAGVVLIGGTSLLPGVKELTRREMKLPVEVGMPVEFMDFLTQDNALLLANACGVLKWASKKSEEPVFYPHVGKTFFKNRWFRWLRSFIP
jgi:cell division protein FtsA